MTSVLKKRSVLPGFGLTLGFSLFYLGVLVLIPLSALVLRSSSLSLEAFWGIVSDPRVLASFRLSFGASFVAAGLNAVFGLLVAWVLVRYTFLGKKANRRARRFALCAAYGGRGHRADFDLRP